MEEKLESLRSFSYSIPDNFELKIPLCPSPSLLPRMLTENYSRILRTLRGTSFEGLRRRVAETEKISTKKLFVPEQACIPINAFLRIFSDYGFYHSAYRKLFFRSNRRVALVGGFQIGSFSVFPQIFHRPSPIYFCNHDFSRPGRI